VFLHFPGILHGKTHGGPRRIIYCRTKVFLPGNVSGTMCKYGHVLSLSLSSPRSLTMRINIVIPIPFIDRKTPQVNNNDMYVVRGTHGNCFDR